MKRGVLTLLLCLQPFCSQAQPIPAQGTVEVAFSPWDDAEGAILHALGETQKSLQVQAYLLTSRNIAKALLAAHQRGVAVSILADRDMLEKSENSQLPQLADAGISIWLETRYAAAHNKVILIDAEEQHPIVITGSYNYTFSAQARNAENLLILRDNRELARRFALNWQRHRAEATPYKAH